MNIKKITGLIVNIIMFLFILSLTTVIIDFNSAILFFTYVIVYLTNTNYNL